MKDNEIIDGYWWCGRCQSTKSPFQVTYEENCTACGSQVEWREDSEPPMPDSQQPTLNVGKIRKCSYLLPAPGGDVVRDLLDEIERLQRRVAELEGELQRHKDAYASYMPDAKPVLPTSSEWKRIQSRRGGERRE